MNNILKTKNGKYILKGDRTSNLFLIFDEHYNIERFSCLYLKHMRQYGNSFNTIERVGYELLYFLNFLDENKICIEKIEEINSFSKLFEDYANYIEFNNDLLPSTINSRVGTIQSFILFLNDNYFKTNKYSKYYENGNYSPFKEFHKKKQIKRKRALRKREAKKDFQIPQFNVRDAIVNLFYSDFICMIGEIKKWNEEQLIKLRDLCLVDLMITSGLRIGETIGLKIEDIEFEQQRINIIDRKDNENLAKAKRGSREVPLSDRVGKRLVILIYKTYELYPNTDYVFINYKGNRKGKAIHRETVTAQFRKYTKKLIEVGLLNNGTIHPHLLRHLCATNLLSNGANLVDVKDVLGHSSVKTTEVYTHILDSKAKKLVNEAGKKLMEDEE